MKVVLGVMLAAVLFGLYTMLRPRDKGGCTGHCAGCTGDGTCETDGVKR